MFNGFSIVSIYNLHLHPHFVFDFKMSSNNNTKKQTSSKPISDLKELLKFQEFIAKKVKSLSEEETTDGNFFLNSVPSPSDTLNTLFLKSLTNYEKRLNEVCEKEKQNDYDILLTYKTYNNVIQDFTKVLTQLYDTTVFGNYFSKDVGINAFRGIIDEFIQKNEKKSAGKNLLNSLGFGLGGLKYSISTKSHIAGRSSSPNPDRDRKTSLVSNFKFSMGHHSMKNKDNPGTSSSTTYISSTSSSSYRKIFGVSLADLKPKTENIPPFLETVICSIEWLGIKEQGLYKISGDPDQVKILINHFEQNNNEAVDWTQISVHVLTNLLLSFFSQLPEPLLTYQYYANFLRASAIEDFEDRIYIISTLLARLPSTNCLIAERLFTHLVKVSKSNKEMNVYELAKIWGPIILKKPQNLSTKHDDIEDQLLITCVQTILDEKKIKSAQNHTLVTNNNRPMDIGIADKEQVLSKFDLENKVEITEFSIQENDFEDLKMCAVQGYFKVGKNTSQLDVIDEQKVQDLTITSDRS